MQLPDFSNTEIAYRYRSTSELKRAKLLFTSFQFQGLVKIGPPMVNFALKLRLPVKPLLKNYLFNHFCGGETLEEALKTARHLYTNGVDVLLDYAVETQSGQEAFEQATEEFLKTLEVAYNKEEVSSVALKPSALCNPAILEKKQAGRPLVSYEKKQYDEFVNRLDRICRKAADLKQIVYIDAEESWIQDEVDKICEAMMEEYNKDEAYIFTTLQMYRKDRLEYLRKLFLEAKKKAYFLGVKLVRGAYMEKERERAYAKKYPSPIHPDKNATDKAFDEAVMFSLEHLSHVRVCIATHNEKSCLLAVRKIQESNLAPNDSRIYFSQLYGMADHISFNLAEAGFNASKYMPYGPLEAALPYLFRRAEENSSIAAQAKAELKRIEKELKRREKQRN